MYPPIPGTTIIGIGNKARHGKDTVAGAIIGRCSSAMRFAFADALKMHCRHAHGMRKKDGALLQRVGMDERAKDPDIWVRLLYDWIDELRPRYAIISDMRIPNELDMVRQTGGFSIRVRRYNADGTPFVSDDRPADHVSEVALDNHGFDFVINNNRGLGDLMTEAVEVFFHIDQDVQARRTVTP